MPQTFYTSSRYYNLPTPVCLYVRFSFPLRKNQRSAFAIMNDIATLVSNGFGSPSLLFGEALQRMCKSDCAGACYCCGFKHPPVCPVWVRYCCGFKHPPVCPVWVRYCCGFKHPPVCPVWVRYCCGFKHPPVCPVWVRYCCGFKHPPVCPVWVRYCCGFKHPPVCPVWVRLL